MSVKAVKKATKIKAEKDMYAAYGWLAKEGKLSFEEIEGELFVALILSRNRYLVRRSVLILFGRPFVWLDVFCLKKTDRLVV